jgi:hypothetical protein
VPSSVQVLFLNKHKNQYYNTGIHLINTFTEHSSLKIPNAREKKTVYCTLLYREGHKPVQSDFGRRQRPFGGQAGVEINRKFSLDLGEF